MRLLNVMALMNEEGQGAPNKFGLGFIVPSNGVVSQGGVKPRVACVNIPSKYQQN